MLFNYFFCKSDDHSFDVFIHWGRELHYILTASSSNISIFLNETGVIDLQVFEETDALG